MDEALEAIIEKLKTSSLKFADEDTGQLDYYSTRFPVKWPCGLVDIAAANFANLGVDKTATPKNRQTADTRVRITLANLKLSNTSGNAPKPQQANSFKIWQLQQEIHELLHGWKPTSNTGALIRTGMQRVKRDDGVQEYEMVYSLSMTNV